MQNKRILFNYKRFAWRIIKIYDKTEFFIGGISFFNDNLRENSRQVAVNVIEYV